MIRRPLLAPLALLLLALAGCGGSDPTPGGLSRSENQELDQAAAATDANAMDNTGAVE